MAKQVVINGKSVAAIVAAIQTGAKSVGLIETSIKAATRQEVEAALIEVVQAFHASKALPNKDKGSGFALAPRSDVPKNWTPVHVASVNALHAAVMCYRRTFKLNPKLSLTSEGIASVSPEKVKARVAKAGGKAVKGSDKGAKDETPEADAKPVSIKAVKVVQMVPTLKAFIDGIANITDQRKLCEEIIAMIQTGGYVGTALTGPKAATA